MKRPTKKPAEGVNWGIMMLRKKAERLGSVRAHTAEEALKIWLQRAPVSKDELRRLAAVREA
jgi:hypothetical protein